MESIESVSPIEEPSHLNPDIKPIMACMDTDISMEHHVISDAQYESADIDAEASSEAPGFFRSYRNGFWAYTISPINTKNKASMRYADCTGVVVAGKKSATGETVSFITHQNPSFFLLYHDDDFLEKFHIRLEELKGQCEPGTIDAALFGGRFSSMKGFKPSDKVYDFYMKEYVDSIKAVSGEIEKTLGFSPEVIVGPKLEPASDHVIFDTAERRLFLHRLKAGTGAELTGNFNAKDIDTVASELEPGEWPLPKEILDKLKDEKYK